MRDEHLTNAERGRVAEDLGLLVGELEHPDVAQELAIEVVVEAQRPDLARTHQPLPVERHAPAPCERNDRLERPFAANEWRDVDPAARRKLRDVARLPDIAERLDRHRAHVTVVREGERAGRFAVDVARRRAEAHERREQRLAVLERAAGDHACGHAQPLQGAGAVEGAAADLRRPAGQEVPREISDERDHALARIGLLATSRAAAASANAAAKLGIDAPPHGKACGWVCATRSVHQLGPCG